MFFCVKRPLKIAGKYYKPCISYMLYDRLLPTIRNLEKEGKAEISVKPVFFQNGRKLEAVQEKTEGTSSVCVKTFKNRNKHQKIVEEHTPEETVRSPEEDLSDF